MSRDLKSGTFLFIFSAIAIFESLRIGIGTPAKPGSGFLSFCAGAGLFGLSCSLIWRSLRTSESPVSHSRKAIGALLTVFVYSLLLEKLGFLIATFGAISVLSCLQISRPWWIQIGFSALVTILAYIIFALLLNVFLPRGIFDLGV